MAKFNTIEVHYEMTRELRDLVFIPIKKSRSVVEQVYILIKS